MTADLFTENSPHWVWMCMHVITNSDTHALKVSIFLSQWKNFMSDDPLVYVYFLYRSENPMKIPLDNNIVPVYIMYAWKL